MHLVSVDRSRFSHSTVLEIAHTRCMLRTNHEAMIRSLVHCAANETDGQFDFSLAVETDQRAASLEPPYFRGMGHLVVARYGENVFLFDLVRRTVCAWVSDRIAGDPELWKRRFLPLILGVLGCAVGVLPVHGACVVKHGQGILIAGESMSGKSTLSVAVAREGLALLSDDWTYIQSWERNLVACGLHVPVKLLPDAVAHFPELGTTATTRTTNGEVAYEVLADETLRVRVVSSCAPEAIVFLERMQQGTPQFMPASPSYVKHYVNNSVERLPRELREIAGTRQELIDALAALPSWHFRYSGSPQNGARSLVRFMKERHEVSQS